MKLAKFVSPTPKTTQKQKEKQRHYYSAPERIGPGLQNDSQLSMQTSGGHGQAFPRRIHSSVWWARTSCPPLVYTKDSGKEQRQKQLDDAFEWNKP
jgi:hypothetical protein